MPSSQYLTIIKKYETTIGEIKSLYSYIENSENIISSCRLLTEETIIDGLPIDKGLLDDIEASLDKLKSNMEYAISRCNSEINVNNILYNTMLSREEKMLKTKNDDK